MSDDDNDHTMYDENNLTQDSFLNDISKDQYTDSIHGENPDSDLENKNEENQQMDYQYQLEEITTEVHSSIDEIRNQFNHYSHDYDYPSSSLSMNSSQLLEEQQQQRQTKKLKVENRLSASGYERRRAARRLDRSLIRLESFLNEHHLPHHDLSRKNILNESIMSDLIITLITVTDEERLGYAPTTSNVTMIRDGNKTLYKTSAEKASRILSNYGVLPLQEHHIDTLIDHLANVFSSNQHYQNQSSHHSYLSSSSSFSTSITKRMEPLLSLLNQSLQHSISNIVLSLEETVQLLDLLLPHALHHLSFIRWYPVTVTNTTTTTASQTSPSNHSQDIAAATSAIQIRIFILFLLLHFNTQQYVQQKQLKQQQKVPIEANDSDPHSDLQTGNENEYNSEENSTSYNLSSNLKQGLNEYVQEMIEYALDSIEGSSHFYLSSSENHSVILQEPQLHVSLAVHTAHLLYDVVCFHKCSTRVRHNSEEHFPLVPSAESILTLFTSYTTFVAHFSKELEQLKKFMHSFTTMNPMGNTDIPFYSLRLPLFKTSAHITKAIANLIVQTKSNDDDENILQKLLSLSSLSNQEEGNSYQNACIITLLLNLCKDDHPIDQNSNVIKKDNREMDDVQFIVEKCLCLSDSDDSTHLPPIENTTPQKTHDNLSTTAHSNQTSRNVTHLLQLAAVFSATTMINLGQGNNIGDRKNEKSSKFSLNLDPQDLKNDSQPRHHEYNDNEESNYVSERDLRQEEDQRLLKQKQCTQERNLAHLCSSLLRESKSVVPQSSSTLSEPSSVDLVRSHHASSFNPWHSLIARKLNETLDLPTSLTENNDEDLENTDSDHLSYLNVISEYCQAVTPFTEA